MITPADIEPVLPDAAKLVAAIMERAAIEPIYAILVMRGLIAAMPASDVVTIIRQPAKPVDPSALVG
jgi:hypothetical protein